MSDMCGVEPLSFSAFGRSSFSATSFSLSFPICPFCLSSKGELQSFDSQQKALNLDLEKSFPQRKQRTVFCVVCMHFYNVGLASEAAFDLRCLHWRMLKRRTS